MNRIHIFCDLVCTALICFAIGMVLSLDVIAACEECRVPCSPSEILFAGGGIFGCLGFFIRLVKILRK